MTPEAMIDAFLAQYKTDWSSRDFYVRPHLLAFIAYQQAGEAAGDLAGRLRALIEHWRTATIDPGFEVYAGWAFGRCANELEAALADRVGGADV